MAEYIIDTAAIGCDGYCPARERIVRCRYCSYYVRERGCCDYRKPFTFKVNPDGFCAWGEEAGYGRD